LLRRIAGAPGARVAWEELSSRRQDSLRLLLNDGYVVRIGRVGECYTLTEKGLETIAREVET
jgi:DNA-binding PadR family transcriptional regulator